MSALATPVAVSAERLLPRDRVESLCDPGTFLQLRSAVTSVALGDRAGGGDGVVCGAGRVGGRPIFCYAQDPGFLGGSLGAAHADSIVEVMRAAGRAGAPVVGFVESGGARMQEGHAALAGYGRIFRESVRLSERALQISIVCGVSAGGGAYSPALTDFVVMTREARMFLTGPKIVQAALGEEVSMEELGGPALHGQNGVCQLVADDDQQAIELAQALLQLLPSPFGSTFATGVPTPSVNGSYPDPARDVPPQARKVYDVRKVARAIADDGRLLELSERWAKNIVTGLAQIEGRTVGVIANQPAWIGGVIDAAASEKAAGFVDQCERFRIPLVVLVDTPGFMPGTAQEKAGVIRHGAALLRAFAAATVPKLTVVLRKAFGGAVITMNSKALGSDLVFAWPQAEIGIMAATQAVGIIHRRLIDASEDAAATHDELAQSYAAEHLNAAAAAAAGFVDEVIDPKETRARLAWALDALEAS